MGALGFILDAAEGERSWRLAEYVKRGGYAALKKNGVDGRGSR